SAASSFAHSTCPSSLHDALPIFLVDLRVHLHLKPPGIGGLERQPGLRRTGRDAGALQRRQNPWDLVWLGETVEHGGGVANGDDRSEEHTSELQSHLNLVCRLLLE